MWPNAPNRSSRDFHVSSIVDVDSRSIIGSRRPQQPFHLSCGNAEPRAGAIPYMLAYLMTAVLNALAVAWAREVRFLTIVFTIVAAHVFRIAGYIHCWYPPAVAPDAGLIIGPPLPVFPAIVDPCVHATSTWRGTNGSYIQRRCVDCGVIVFRTRRFAIIE